MHLTEFPINSFDKVRYGDTDRQGHVNNAVFATFLETGRTEILYDENRDIAADNCSFVIAALELQFLREIHWPGRVDIGTGIEHIGNSSIRLRQGLFQNGACVASAITAIVQVGNQKGKSAPLTDDARKRLSQWLVTDPD